MKNIYQEHHPNYHKPDFTIRLRRFHHLVVTRVQRLKPSLENIGAISNLISALSLELGYKLEEVKKGVSSSSKRVVRGGK